VENDREGWCIYLFTLICRRGIFLKRLFFRDIPDYIYAEKPGFKRVNELGIIGFV